MDREQVIAKIRPLLPELRREYSVAALGLFGSVARGDAGTGSDLDVLVQFEPGATVTLFTLARLSQRLEEVLGRSVDLVEDHDGLSRAFRSSVQRDLLRVA